MVEHFTELEEPHVMRGYFVIYFQQPGVQHYQLPDWNLVYDQVLVLVLVVVVIERNHEHDGAALGVGWHFALPAFIRNLAIL